ncbi:hypothetical protein EVAR_6232_1 [Eumeta japonica]|uniref:Uncharacterized protein n=1 Tax=Eumeta variegata TaxID=151549 RepID=A0A4C1T844_EUMVA|nr:hypothetical protein EVAR_6232_1 [Eumeta japonica]
MTHANFSRATYNCACIYFGAVDARRTPIGRWRRQPRRGPRARDVSDVTDTADREKMEGQFQMLFEKMKLEMQSQNAELKDSITNSIMEKMDEKLIPVIEENKKLKTKVEKLEREIEYLKRAEKNNNIVVFCLEENEQSSTELIQKLKETFNLDMNVKIEEYDINKIYRLAFVRSPFFGITSLNTTPSIPTLGIEILNSLQFPGRLVSRHKTTTFTLLLWALDWDSLILVSVSRPHSMSKASNAGDPVISGQFDRPDILLHTLSHPLPRVL